MTHVSGEANHRDAILSSMKEKFSSTGDGRGIMCNVEMETTLEADVDAESSGSMTNEDGFEGG